LFWQSIAPKDWYDAVPEAIWYWRSITEARGSAWATQALANVAKRMPR
jgi:hypothetical protein